MLGDYAFEVAYAHIGLCALRIAETLTRRFADWDIDAGNGNPIRAIELLDTVFYRERRAYLVGLVVDVPPYPEQARVDAKSFSANIGL